MCLSKKKTYCSLAQTWKRKAYRFKLGLLRTPVKNPFNIEFVCWETIFCHLSVTGAKHEPRPPRKKIETKFLWISKVLNTSRILEYELVKENL